MFKFDPNSTKNEGRFRLRDPKDFVSSSYKTIKTDIGINYIIGIPKNSQTNDYEVQAIRFKKKLWSKEDAYKWWNKHKGKYKKLWKPGDWNKEIPEKITVKEALKIAKSLARKLKIKYISPDKITIDSKFIKDVIIPVGSIRRNYENKEYKTKDIDLLITKKIHKENLKDIEGIEILSGGDVNTKIIYKNIKIDLFVLLNPKTWGAGILHYSGPFNYNMRLRAMIKKPKWTDIHGSGWKLSQNGLFHNDKVITTYTERELQQYLGIKERPPKDRK